MRKAVCPEELTHPRETHGLVTDKSHAPFSVLHGRLYQNFIGIFKPLHSHLGSLFIPKLFNSAPAPNPFGVQSQSPGASDLGLDPVPSAPQAATSERQYRGWKEWTPRKGLPAQDPADRSQGKKSEGPRPGRGAH